MLMKFGEATERRMAKLLQIISLILLAASFLSGPLSIYFADIRRYQTSIGILFLGIALGVGGLIGSLIAVQMHYGELADRGHRVINDMPGYGQALVGGLGLIYFSAVFAIILIIVAVRRVCSWHRLRKKGRD
ncbi:hypothetical protein CAF53_20925 [Sphingobium sp. LB126]|uniref:hypothetical protein n=1 Tax=Sphingobium sp. LB126 TaxID=1983755 RepID=UPI000C20AF62|nr:hypothetical protein [Sphingobium sp. LB126]PJG46608.1 hypothetical protein CAF53_20925 [Sphingobium sp. LB126]